MGSLGVILLIIVIVVVLGGGLPQAREWHGYGWGPSGIGGILLLVLLILLLTGRL